jgi:tRNA1Val (adenine37-N6)-methyltransferase
MRQNKPFHFQKFSINHSRCAHKVGTDATLLGSWVKPQIQALRILDIGSGSSVMSLMLAQRFPKAQILGLEVDASSYLDAQENVSNAIFGPRVQVENIDFLQFQSKEPFDLIVSNPPYFTSTSISPVASRAIARSMSMSDFSAWADSFKLLLSKKGELGLILPFDSWEVFHSLLEERGFHLKEKLKVKHHATAPYSRVLLKYCLQKEKFTGGELVLFQKPGRAARTTEFQEMMADFLLP